MTGREIVLFIISSMFIMNTVVSFNQAAAEAGPVLTDGGKIYSWYCTPCHGLKGDGNGFNAKNLDPRPASHADANLMTKRTDQELFDAISGGGKGAGKSTLMPPWGNTFNKDQINFLVLYLRKLCGCRSE